jgi:hypothetical protein
MIEQEAPTSEAPVLLRQLQDAPPQTGVYGYQTLPKITEIPTLPNSGPVSSFTYSWTITEGYIEGETTKLTRALTALERVATLPKEEKRDALAGLIREYRNLVRDQRTVDQYVQYNRFWQNAIATDRARFDVLTELYHQLKAGNRDSAESIRKVLGKPVAPSFIRVDREGTSRITLKVPVHTDIEDKSFLDQARHAIEDLWRVDDSGIRYSVKVDFKSTSVSSLYRNGKAPRRGDHLDVLGHIARFPSNGGVLTTGAQFTNGGVGRYVVLGPGDLTPRTLAHEFGHLLGFGDGYVRGYRDLGEQGFEILELTAFFDDIMTAPREGRVQPTHFKLLMEALAK